MLENILDKARGSADVEPAASPLNEPGVWEFFLSHNQALGGDQMKTLSLLFERNKTLSGTTMASLTRARPRWRRASSTARTSSFC